MTAAPKPHKISDFEGVLLAIAGHDLRQPLQVIQSAHELLGLGVRTSSELRSLRSGQNAIDRLKEQLEQILTALRVRGCMGCLELTPVRVHQVLRQACRENQRAALSKGISIHMVSSDATILSESLFLGAALRNLVSNAIKYTEPGGRVLLGCKQFRSGIRTMCTTRALESLVNRFRRSSRLSPALMPHNATVWASVSSSCAKRSEFWATALTSLLLPAAGRAFPSSSHARRRGSEPERALRKERKGSATKRKIACAVPTRSLLLNWIDGPLVQKNCHSPSE